MNWLELARSREKDLYAAVLETVERAMDDRSGRENKCYGVQLFSDGRISVAEYMDLGFPCSVCDGINVYSVRCVFAEDVVEDSGNGNESAERLAAEIPFESKAVMRVLKEETGEEMKMYKNRFFEVFSQMFHDEYDEYRKKELKRAAEAFIERNSVMKQVFCSAEAADREKAN